MESIPFHLGDRNRRDKKVQKTKTSKQKPQPLGKGQEYVEELELYQERGGNTEKAYTRDLGTQCSSKTKS